MVTAGELTHTSQLELTGLRVRVKELENQLETQESHLRKKIQQEYSSLAHNLLSTSTAVTAHYEDYRNSLYSDVLQCVREVRAEASGCVARMKESYGSSDTAVKTLSGEEECDILEENAQLNKLLLKQQAMSQLCRHVHTNQKEREVCVWREECERVRRGELEEGMLREVEIHSLHSQVNCLHKGLTEVERERSSAQRELADKKEVSISCKTPTDRTKPCMAQPALKSARTTSMKIKQLNSELEEKAKQICQLESAKEKQHREDESGQKRLSHELQVTRQQLQHLKREAFHRVDDLLTQVHDLEDQQHKSLQSLQTGRRVVTSSIPHSLTTRHHHTSTPHSLTTRHHHTSTPHSTPRRSSGVSNSAPHSRPDSQQQRRVGNKLTSRSFASQDNDTTDISQEILALKLI